MIDLFEEARAIELDERLATGVRGHHRPPSCCERPPPAATRASAGPTAAGSRPGALADLVTVGARLRAARRHRAEHAVEAARVRGGAPRDVRHVIVGGALDRARRRAT